MKPIVFALTLTLLAACGGRDAQNVESTTSPGAAPAAVAQARATTPEQLGELGAQLRKEPARADEILAARGHDAESFEQAIRTVTENPEASRRYAAAYRKASS